MNTWDLRQTLPSGDLHMTVDVVGSDGVGVDGIICHANRSGGYQSRVDGGCSTDGKKHT